MPPSSERSSWFEKHSAIVREEIERAGWPELPITPPCKHMEPHRPRPLETDEDLVRYMVFRACGWESAGYCWSYVPAFLHEWFGCGPDQELFKPKAARAY